MGVTNETMFIRKINRQYRRDFYADFECEGCGYIEKIIPAMMMPTTTRMWFPH